MSTSANGDRYSDFYKRSVEQPELFWAEQARLIDWFSPPTRICNWDNPPYAHWFEGGKTNLCHNAGSTPTGPN